MRIACVHQGYELYGSDRAFLDAVQAFRCAWPTATIEAVVPRDGALAERLLALGVTVVVEPLWVLRRRDLRWLATAGLLSLPGRVLAARRRMARSDLTYVNTAVVVDHLLAARWVGGRVLVHVHELPGGTTRRVLRALLRWSRAALVVNSEATRRAFGLPATTVYNGVAGPSVPPPATYDGGRPLRLLMLGRFNAQKGQGVLLSALAMLPPALRERLSVWIVGSAFEEPDAEAALRAEAASSNLSGIVTIKPFLPDPDPLYRWADIVVVPSRWGEALGRVAIEALAYGRPVIASAVGGLPEVVEDGRSGWLVAPDSAEALAAGIARAVSEPEFWRPMPAAARARYEAMFSEPIARRALIAAAARVLERSP